jgi:hypothetical protein
LQGFQAALNVVDEQFPITVTPTYFLFVWDAWNFLQLSGSIVPPFYATRMRQMLLRQQDEWSIAYVEDVNIELTAVQVPF